MNSATFSCEKFELKEIFYLKVRVYIIIYYTSFMIVFNHTKEINNVESLVQTKFFS